MLNQTPLRILIAEDDAAIHEEIKSLIVGLGFTVAGDAYNGPQAVSLAEQLKPDVILLDIVMPDPDSGKEDKQAGIRSTEEILKQQPVPIVWLTAYETPQMIAEASRLGVSAYLVKPPQSNEIARAVTLAHARFADMQELRRLNTALQQEIVERKQAELELRKLTRAVEQSPASIVITNLDGLIEYVNPRFEQVTGYRYEEAVGQNPRILKSEHTPRETYGEMWSTLTAGKEWHGEFVNRKKDGSLYYESASISPIIDPHGSVTHYLAVKEDVTERKQMEDQLIKLSQAVEQSGNTVIIMDKNGLIEYVNPKFTEVSGYLLAEVLGKSPAIMYGLDETPDFTQDEAWKTINAGKIWRGEFKNYSKDGSVFWEFATIAPVRNAAGETINFVEIKQDITKQKLAEEARLRSESKYTNLYNNTPTMYFTIDADGTTLSVNSFGASQLGYTPQELVGHSVLNVFYEADKEKAVSYVKKCLENTSQLFNWELRKVRKDGSMLWVKETAWAVQNQEDKYVVFVACDDITEQKLLQEQLQKQNDYLSILHQISLDLLNRHDIHDLFQVIVDRSAALLDAPFSELMLEENGVLVVTAFTDNQPELKGDHVTRAEAKLSWQAFDTHQPVVIDDYAVWEHRREVYDANLHATAEFPIIAGDRCLGILALGRSQLNYKFTAEQIETGVLFARLAALVLDNANLYETAMKEMDESRRMEEALFSQNQNLAVLHKIIYALLDTRDFTSVLNEIVTQAAEIAGASYGYIFLAEGDDLVLRSATGNFASNIGSREKKPGTGVLGQVWQTTKLLVVENYAEWEGRDLSYSKWNLRALADIPIIGRDGPLGVLGVARPKEDLRKFTSQEIDTLVQLTALASLVLDNAQLYEAAMKEIAERTHAEALLQQKSLELESERQKSERLLLNILPVEVVEKLKNNINLIADHFDEASILFADIVDFTGMSAAMTPNEVVNMLNEIFSKFDEFTERHNLEKIKTIGDCYMVASGAPRLRKDHACAVARLALEFQNYADNHLVQGRKLSFRIGIHSGAVIAGVIGQNKFIYDMWGDTVNIASRMESHGMGGSIQVTQATYDLIKDQFACEPRGMISVKGKGDMTVWYLKGEK